MFCIHGAVASGVGTIDHQELTIEKGVTAIYGLNKGTAGTENSNASGKSFLFGNIFDTLFEYPIGPSEYADRIQSGMRGVRFSILEGGKRVKCMVKRENKKATLMYGSKRITGITNVRKKLAEILPINSDDFETYIHLDSMAPHPLVRGSSASRLRFLTSFFSSIGAIDSERQIIKSWADSLKVSRGQYDELRSEVHRLQKQVPTNQQFQASVQKLKEMERELDALTSDAEKAESQRLGAMFRDQASEEIEHYKKGVLEANTTNPEKVLAFYRELLVENEQIYAESKAYAEYRTAKAQYEKWYSSLSGSTLDLMGTYSNERIFEHYAKASEDKVEYDSLTSQMERLRAECKSVSVPPKPSMSKGECQSRISALEHQLEHATKFGKGACPTCGQSVKVKDPASIKSMLSKLNRIADQWDEYDRASYKAEQVAERRAEYTELKNKRASIKVRDVDALRTATRELRNAVAEPEPVEIGNALPLDIAAKSVDEIKDRVKALAFLCRNKDSLKAALSVKDGESDSLLSRVSELTEKCTVLRARLLKAKDDRAELKAMQTKLESYNQKLKTEKDCQILMEAYDPKGLKRMVISVLSQHLMAQINKYAKLAFDEDLRFRLVWEKTQVQLLVDRYYHGRKEPVTSDVRRLSGAETTLFTIITVLALLNFVPSHRRSNVLIMDEPTAHFGPSNIEKFKELLPLLLSVIPSIIIITPKVDQRYRGAREYTAVKEKNGAIRLCKGHPSNIEEH